MDTTTFAQKIKAKYPAYQNIDDATLVNKIIEKYPEYKSQVQQTPAIELQTDTGSDITQTKQAIGETINRGVDKYAEIQARQDAGLQGGLRTKLQQLGVGAGTASGVLGETILGAGKVLLPQSAENAVKYGAEKVITPIIQSEPVQSLLSKYEQLKTSNPKLAQDIDSILGLGQLALDVTGVGVGAKGAKVAGKAGMEAVQTGAESAIRGAKVAGETIGNVTEAGAKIASDVIPTRKGVISGQISKALDLTPGDISNIKASTGNDVGEWIANKNLIGGNKEETLKAIGDLSDTQYKAVRDEIAKVKKTYTLSDMPRMKDSIVLLESQVKGVPGLEETYKEVRSLLRKKSYTLSDAQRVKELLDDQFSLFKATGDVKEGTVKKGLANVRKDVKEFIEKEVKDTTGADIKALNNDVSTGRSILEDASVRASRDLTRANVSLADLGFFGTGSLIGTPLFGAAALLGKRIVESPTVRLKIASFLKGLPSKEKTAIKNELLNGKVPDILKKEVSQSLKPSASNMKNSNSAASDIPTVSKKNGIMSSDLSTGVKKAYNNAKETLKTLKDKNVRERGSISLESILPEQKLKGNQSVSLAKNTTEDLLQQAKKYKSAEEFVKAISPSYSKLPDSPLYHGTSANIKNGKLTFGAGNGVKKGGQSGGHFLSDSKKISEVFAGNGKVYIIDPAYKKNILDLTSKRGIKEIENYIGNTYKTYDGEKIIFTRDDFDIMFPNGKTDFASISQYPELIEQITRKRGYRGIAFDEYAGGETGKTYQILHSDNIPIIEQKKISDSELAKLIKEKTEIEPKATDLRLEEYGRNQDGYLTDNQIDELDYLEKRVKEIDNILISSDYKSQLEEIWKKANKK